jgi:hypothetical protein
MGTTAPIEKFGDFFTIGAAAHVEKLSLPL